ncbi:MAG: Aminotransferase class I and II [Parcubacteria group bacterium GW2011_GWA2_38_13]|nr:MAG: Aminotransferase class I and II [Parcubacteria group bacterium GW2011_GWA2_38_13]
MLHVSHRANSVLASPIRKFLPMVLDAEKKGIHVYKINVGDPDIFVPKEFWRGLKMYKEKTIGYAPSTGIREHTEAWVKYYKRIGIKLEPKNIIPTVGCAEAILLAMMAVADPGDEVIVFEPMYTSYKGFASMSNITLVPITLKIENNFSLPDESEIVKKITKRTKAIIVINPNNPTGSILSKKEMDMIVRIAVKHNLYIIADEAYREIVFSQKPTTFLSYINAKENIIVLDSISKKFSCPGTRIGSVASFNEDFMRAILKFAMVRLSAPTLEQYGAIPLLLNAPRLTKEVTKEYKKRRDIVYKGLKKIPGVFCTEPKGALYIIAKLPIANAEGLVEFLLKKFSYKNKTVLVTPAEDFYITKGLGRNEIRIAYVLNTKALKDAMDILQRGIRNFLM